MSNDSDIEDKKIDFRSFDVRHMTTDQLSARACPTSLMSNR